MSLAAILARRGIGAADLVSDQSVPAAPFASRVAGTAETLVRRAVPGVPTAPGEQLIGGSDSVREGFEERSAIMEYDGGMSREEAEREALALITTYHRVH